MNPRFNNSFLCVASSDTVSKTPHAVPPAAVNLSIHFLFGRIDTPSRTKETPRCMASSTSPSTLESSTLHVSIQDLTGSSVESSDAGAVGLHCKL